MKLKLKKQIKDLLKGKDKTGRIIFYFCDTFHVINKCKLIEISQSEAVEYLTNECEFWHLLESNRKFDMDKDRWIGTDPVHILPEGLPQCKIVNVTCSFPVTNFMQLFIGFARDSAIAAGSPIITGFNYIKPE